MTSPLPSNPNETRPGPVTIAGLLHSTKSFGEAARLSLAALSVAGYDVRFIDIGPTFRECDFMDARFPGLPAEPGGGVLIVHANPHMLPHTFSSIGQEILEGKYVIGYFVWELPSIPPDFREQLHLVHEIWVPSSFALKPFVTGTDKPVRVVPHPIAIEERMRALDSATRSSRVRFGIPEGPFTVLFMQNLGSTITRKNAIGAVRAFRRAFCARLDRRLVLKLGDAHKWPDALSRLRQEVADAPNVLIVQECLTTEEVKSLIASCDAVLSLHRAEGFGMVLAEAMLLAKPVVATRWSGNLDFMTDENSALIDFTLVPALDDQRVYRQPEQCWAEPNIEAAATWLCRLADEPELRHNLGARARADVIAKLGQPRYEEAVRDILALHHRPAWSLSHGSEARPGS
jgi:glycosyltransferase involved in cell wall biosynthesis